MTTAARTRDAVATLIVAAAVALSAWSVQTVVWPGAWQHRTGLAVLVLAAGVAGTRWAMAATADPRSSSPARYVPTAVGLVLAALLWFALGTAGDAQAAHELPSVISRTLVESTRLYGLAHTSVAPIDPSAPVTVVVLGVALLSTLAADLLAVPWRRPVAASAVTAVLWAPSLVIAGHVPVPALVATCVAPLALLALDRAAPAPSTAAAPARSPAGRGTRGRAAATTSGVVGVVAAATIVALAAGSSLGAVRGGDGNPLASLFGSTASSGRLGNDLNVLQDLGERPEAVVMTVEAPTDLSSVGPLRLYTLSQFDGSSWAPQDPRRSSLPVVSAATLTGPGPVPRHEGTKTLRITPRLLPHTHLAVPTEPRRISSSGTVRYDKTTDELYRDGTDTAAYTLSVRSRPLDATTLAGQEARYDDGSVPSAVQDQTLAVPKTSHSKDVTALAKQITAGAQSDYERSLLIQNFLRGGTFTYTTKAPPAKSGDAVWDFLQARHGYCVQFATAMAIMLRDLGIPTRVGVGYLVRPDGDGTRADVRGIDAHAWPEVYFASSGWVRFEPTPAVQAGAAPAWAPMASSGFAQRPDTIPQDVPSSRAKDSAPEQTADSNGSQHDVSTSTASDVQRGHRWIAPLAGFVVLLLGASGLWFVRRRTVRAGLVDAEAAWNALGRRLTTLGVGWSPSTTPRQATHVVDDAVRSLAGHGLDEATTHALTTLAVHVEADRYARSASPNDPVELANLVDDVVAGVQSAVSGRHRSGDAPSVPRAGS